MARKSIVLDRVFEHYDSDGYAWELEAPDAPMIEVWRENEHLVLLRQDNGVNVDLISLTTGQVYDLMITMARVLEV